MYESRKHPLLPRERFRWRLVRHAGLALGVLLVSVLIGMAGYIYYENLTWRSAFLNTTMLLGGMGPVDAPQTDSGKLFAGCYALYAGLIFLVIVGVIAAPIVHRMLHKFHLQQDR